MAARQGPKSSVERTSLSLLLSLLLPLFSQYQHFFPVLLLLLPTSTCCCCCCYCPLPLPPKYRCYYYYYYYHCHYSTATTTVGRRLYYFLPLLLPLLHYYLPRAALGSASLAACNGIKYKV